MDFVPGFVMGLREGLEAFLVVAVMLRYIKKINQPALKKSTWYGVILSIILSILLGFALYGLSIIIDMQSEAMTKLWEFIVSLIVVFIITTFILHMIQHGAQMNRAIEQKMAVNVTKKGVFFIAFFMILREGVEIALFIFAYESAGIYITGTLTGVMLSAVLVILVYFAIVKVPLKTIFKVTLLYLILQAGFLFGYGIHEGISYLLTVGTLSPDSLIAVKLFNLSGTIFSHTDGVIGVPLYALIGWYSKPEVIQFILQYGYTALLTYMYIKTLKKEQLS